jgi:hypothetical protein
VAFGSPLPQDLAQAIGAAVGVVVTAILGYFFGKRSS